MRALLSALLVTLAIAACSSGDQAGSVGKDEDPVKVAKIEGSDLKSVTLTARAAERLGIVTQPVREVPAANGLPAARAIPLAAVIYDTKGDAWAYAVKQPLTYVRKTVKVARVQSDLAIFQSGPEVGTEVVIVGVAELWGVESGVGGG